MHERTHKKKNVTGGRGQKQRPFDNSRSLDAPWLEMDNCACISVLNHVSFFVYSIVTASYPPLDEREFILCSGYFYTRRQHQDLSSAFLPRDLPDCQPLKAGGKQKNNGLAAMTVPIAPYYACATQSSPSCLGTVPYPTCLPHIYKYLSSNCIFRVAWPSVLDRLHPRVPSNRTYQGEIVTMW